MKPKKIKAVNGVGIMSYMSGKIIAVCMTEKEAGMWCINNPSISHKTIPVLINPLKK